MWDGLEVCMMHGCLLIPCCIVKLPIGNFFKVVVYDLVSMKYPHCWWETVLTQYSPTLTHEQKQFNYRLSRARVVVEIPFGRLKARWRRLSKQMDIHIDNVPPVVAACCIICVRFMVTLSMKNGYKTTVPMIQTSHMITIPATEAAAAVVVKEWLLGMF